MWRTPMYQVNQWNQGDKYLLFISVWSLPRLLKSNQIANIQKSNLQASRNNNLHHEWPQHNVDVEKTTFKKLLGLHPVRVKLWVPHAPPLFMALLSSSRAANSSWVAKASRELCLRGETTTLNTLPEYRIYCYILPYYKLVNFNKLKKEQRVFSVGIPFLKYLIVLLLLFGEIEWELTQMFMASNPSPPLWWCHGHVVRCPSHPHPLRQNKVSSWIHVFYQTTWSIGIEKWYK